MVLSNDHLFIECRKLRAEFLRIPAANNVIIFAVNEQSGNFALRNVFQVYRKRVVFFQ